MTDNTAHLPERRDARRNREAVIDAAIELLAEHPEASMAEVAAASGVGRTTVYRHFPHRDDLLKALYRRVVEDAHAVVIRHVDASRAASRESGADASTERGAASAVLPTLVAIVEELASLGHQYRFLDGRREEVEELQAVIDEVGPEPLASFIAGGQASGELNAELTVEWIAEVLHHFTVMVAGQHRRGDRPEAETRRMLELTLGGALRA